MKTSILLMIVFLLSACSNQVKTNSGNAITANPPTGTNTDPVLTDPVVDPPSTGSSAITNGLPIAQYNIQLAGHLSWRPMIYNAQIQAMINDNLDPHMMTMTSDELQGVFSSDGRLRLKLFLPSQPEPIQRNLSGNMVGNCVGRAPGPDNNYNASQGGSHRYEKINLTVNAYYSSYNASTDTWNPVQSFFTKEIKNLKTNSSTDIIDIPSYMLQGAGVTTMPSGQVVGNPIIIRIGNVRTDMYCATQQAGGYQCDPNPARPQECYNIRLQVVNDKTVNFSE